MNSSSLNIRSLKSISNRKKISNEEIAEVFLNHIDNHNKILNAYTYINRGLNLKKTKHANNLISGTPYALKDIIDYKGIPTSCNSRLFKENIARESSEIAIKTEDIGGLFLGKLNTNEFACGGIPTDALFPMCRNPWNINYTTGGSSSGSAVAVAADMALFTIATDTNGSIRSPASYCGVVGLKPTYGLISTKGVFPLAPTADHVGPICKTVEDAALVMEAITSRKYLHQINIGVRGLRIGIDRNSLSKLSIANHVLENIEECLNILQNNGAIIVNVNIGDLNDYNSVARGILSCEGWSIHSENIFNFPELYGTGSKERLIQGAFFTTEDYINIKSAKEYLSKKLFSLFDLVDLVITPSYFDDPPLIDDKHAKDKRHLTNFHLPFNVSGQPAIVVPTKLSATNHMPMSIQIAANHNNEDLIFRCANIIDEYFRFHENKNNFSLNYFSN